MGPTTLLRAQGVRYDNIVLGPRGGPVAAANIAVCAAGASTSSAPCSPLATIYSDEALTQPLANPMQADSLGNYGFWAAPGHYIVQIYGAGVTTRTMNVFLPCDPSNCSMSNATFSSITAGTLNLTGSLTVNGRSVATEPKANDAVMYVSPNGSDSNDGLSWGSAKQTLYSAVLAMQTSGATTGTVFVGANSSCGGPVSGQGLWLIGANDPAYSSPPSGWIKLVNKTLRVIGVGTDYGGPNQPAPGAQLSCGSSSTTNMPAIWIAGSGNPLYFENLVILGNASNSVRLGISPDGNRTTSLATSIVFKNDTFSVQSNATAGPVIDIGANSFWIWFDHMLLTADSAAASLTDPHQAIVVNPTSGALSSGLITLEHSVINNGGVHFYGNGGNGGSLTVDDLTTENENDGSPAVWFTVQPGNVSSGIYRVIDVNVADATVNPTYAVKFDNLSTNSVENPSLVVANVGGYGQNVSGPMTILGQYPNNLQNITTEPSASGQVGIFADRLYGQVDAARRLFPPTTIRWANKISALPSSWPASGDGTITPTSVTGPDGASGSAGDYTESGGTYGYISFDNSSDTYTAGDYLIAGGWYRSVDGGYGGNGTPFTFNTNSPCASTPIYGGQYFGGEIKGDGEWQWASAAIRITTGGSCYTTFQGPFNPTHEMQYFGPVLIHIPAGQASDSEAAEIAQNLASFPDSLNPPVEATLRGHPFAFGGSGDNYFATLDHTALTANRDYSFPDVNGAVCLTTTCGGQVGQISISSATSGSHSFGSNYNSAPLCVASPTSSPGSTTWWVTSSTSSVTVTLSASSTITFNYACFGNPN